MHEVPWGESTNLQKLGGFILVHLTSRAHSNTKPLSVSLSGQLLRPQMSHPISVDILSDDDDNDCEPQNHALTTPLPPESKKQRVEHISSTSVLVIDDDPTPRKPAHSTSTPSFVAETPMSGFSNSDVAIVKCTRGFCDPQLRFSGIRGLICLESDDESEKGYGAQGFNLSEKSGIGCEVENDFESSATLTGSSFCLGDENLEQTSVSLSYLHSSRDGMTQFHDNSTEENGREGKDLKRISKSKANMNKDKDVGGANGRKRTTEEEKNCLKEEKKQQREHEKLQKAAKRAEAAELKKLQKDEAAELKKLQKDKQKWETGKFALKSIVAEIDTKVVELGSVGGHLLTRFAEKGLTYRITSNPIARSIVWNMTVPEEISQLSSKGTEILYLLLVFEAEEFCKLVMNESLMDHVSRVRSRYPSHTVCYLTNRLMAYINKREQSQYKNPANYSGWRRPAVEEVISKLSTHFVRVHSRQCIDEAELADHVVGLTSSLASCQYRKGLTRLSVKANGSLVPNDCIDKNLIKKNTWLKALVAIPKVQPRFAIAIWKKYPTMKSLLSVYMDPNKSVHEKEFLLEDLKTEVLLGEDRRLGEVCSKRVYRILTAQCGTIKTDDVEDGADFFQSHLT